VSDVAAHASQLRQAQYMASSLRYVSSELQRLLEVVVLAPAAEQGILSGQRRWEELEALLALWAELGEQAPEGLRRDLKALWRHVQLALPHLVVFAESLEQVQPLKISPIGSYRVPVTWEPSFQEETTHARADRTARADQAAGQCHATPAHRRR
jgi:hypothetical protein